MTERYCEAYSVDFSSDEGIKKMLNWIDEKLDGKGNGFDLKTFQEIRGKITSTVGSNHNGFGHNNQLLNSPFPDRAVAKRALLSVDGFLCGKV